MKNFIFILLISISGFAQNTIDETLEKYNSNSVEYISVDKLGILLQKKSNIKLLDTRAKSEFDVSHLKKAIYVGYDEFQLEKIQHKLNKNDTLIVYCSVGVRSEQIGKRFQKAGFKNVYNLYGGLFQWKNEGKPIFNQYVQETDSIHGYDLKWGKLIQKGIVVYD